MDSAVLRPTVQDADDTRPALRFITCGSVDDGKSTLIGRLLLDSRSVLQDQLASVSKSGAVDLALFTDGLSAEREQGITIDVAYRYFSTARRKFIIGDAPGHEQYTRNMVTAASSADAAVVLVDATKLTWSGDASPSGLHALLPQTRRHTLLLQMLRVPSVVFAVNKLDAVADPALAFANIRHALERFAQDAGVPVTATVPMSALQGHNVVTAASRLVWVHRPQPARHPGGPARQCRGSVATALVPGAVDREVCGLQPDRQGAACVLGPRRHRKLACRTGDHNIARRPGRHGGRGAGPRARAG